MRRGQIAGGLGHPRGPPVRPRRRQAADGRDDPAAVRRHRLGRRGHHNDRERCVERVLRPRSGIAATKRWRERSWPYRDFRFRGSLGVTADDVDGFLAYVRSVRAALGDYRCIIDDMIVNGEGRARRAHDLHRRPSRRIARCRRDAAVRSHGPARAFFTVPRTAASPSYGCSAISTASGASSALMVGHASTDAVSSRLNTTSRPEPHLGRVADHRLEGATSLPA